MYLLLPCLSNFELLHELKLRRISDHWITEQLFYYYYFDKTFVKGVDCMFCYILRNWLFLGVCFVF